MKKLKFSKEVLFQEIEKGVYIGWNRFYPKLLRLNDDAVNFLNNIENVERQGSQCEKTFKFIDELLDYKFLYEGDVDPSREHFLDLIGEEYDIINHKVEEFYRLEQDYSQLYIHNNICNLKCPYCVKNYKNYTSNRKITVKEKKHIIYQIIDQYVDRKAKYKVAAIPICFNGGEILLEWDIVKSILIRNQQNYPNLKFKYFLNTNMTLMTEEIAEFMSRYDLKVDISIDGYSSAHDLTRRYSNGKGSFDDVIAGLEIFRKYNKKSKIKNFQGTIDNPDTFETARIFEMGKYGFESARLSPNLLNVTKEEALKKAKIIEELLKLNLAYDFNVSDTGFDIIRKLLNSKEYRFHLHCMGLSCLPRIGLFFNISTMKLSHLCSFLSKPTINVEDCNFDIYNPKLWEISRKFIKERLEVLKNYCIECEIVAICRGDCVMSGLDCGDSDSHKKEFIKSVNNLFRKVNRNASKFYKNQKPYNNLVITNDACNMQCSYCVNKYKKFHPPEKMNSEAKLKILNQVVDQFFSRIVKNSIKKTRISFNGGEILLEWKLIKATIERISKKYKDINIEYAINTNMTIMNKEIAEFLNKHQFKVFISIDGYKSIHNKTRKYKSGEGSFNDIIRNLKIFRKYNNYFINGFQGTLEYPEEFRPEEVYKMEKYGFIEARLAPNLLNVSSDDAVKKAKLMERFIDLNPDNKLKVTELYFGNMTKIIDQENYTFFFNCLGVSAYPDIQFSINISTIRATHLCTYIPSASLPFKELEYDIYNPNLWTHSSHFIQKRISALFDNCLGCELIALCRGGCIYTGLDNENKLNPSACAYQKELWKIYVKKAYEDSQ